MNYILVIFLSIIIQISSLNKIKPKLCINCEHFIPTIDDKFGKCALFPTLYSKNFYLVNGVAHEDDHNYCYIARTTNNMCSKNGNFYTKKYKKRKASDTSNKDNKDNKEDDKLFN
jgi:hypothetical protein